MRKRRNSSSISFVPSLMAAIGCSAMAAAVCLVALPQSADASQRAARANAAGQARAADMARSRENPGRGHAHGRPQAPVAVPTPVPSGLPSQVTSPVSSDGPAGVGPSRGHGSSPMTEPGTLRGKHAARHARPFGNRINVEVHHPIGMRRPGEQNSTTRFILGAGDLYAPGAGASAGTAVPHSEGGIAGGSPGKSGDAPGKSGDAPGKGGGGNNGGDGGGSNGGGKGDHPVFGPEDYPLGKFHYFPGKGKSTGEHVYGWHWGWGGPTLPPDGNGGNGNGNGGNGNGNGNGGNGNGNGPNGGDSELISVFGDLWQIGDVVLREAIIERSLEQMGIYVRAASSEELRRAALGGRELYDSLPQGLDAPPSARAISINRLRRASVVRAIDLFVGVFGSPESDPDALDAIVDERSEIVRAVIADAWNAFLLSEFHDEDATLAEAFNEFLVANAELEEARTYIERLSVLGRELWVMGLTRAEFRYSINRILGRVTTAELDQPTLERLLRVDRVGS